MGSIYLIRHGQASFGAADYDVLSSVGVRQAQVVGAHLAALGVRFDRCLAGTLRRQQDTARLALAELGEAPALETDPAFDEFDAEGLVRGLLPLLLVNEPQALEVMRNAALNRNEFQRLFALLVEHWLDGSRDPAGLEGWAGFLGRVEAGLQRVLDNAAKGDNVAIFTSGGVITALLHLITGMPASRAFEANWQIVNTSLSVLKFRGREVSLASFNSDTHLQLTRAPELLTWR
ncbi:histidine phosphatase family protein [Pseudomonas sp. HR96]|uniref:histidine phosphatase family protein n=1 Tax=Pseudomonas sp. HR96 TaxID=1027966 RepID=UPI002A757AD4|nr:histidine phosphatase family protein [Pseudomonas sp. HR96]WPO97920.1 histidine phosphatase family protein [Pseudomonas sp. HR96]